MMLIFWMDEALWSPPCWRSGQTITLALPGLTLSQSSPEGRSLAFLVPCDLHVKRRENVTVVLFEGQLGFGSQLHVFRSVTSFISQVCRGVVRLPGDSW